MHFSEKGKDKMATDKRKIKRIIILLGVMISTVFAGLSIVARFYKKSSTFDNEPQEKNSMEGKKVVFVKDDNDKENADGIRGHLKAIGDSKFNEGFYDKYVKRSIDIIFSFGGLVVLSPVFVMVALAIFIEDPGPIFFSQKRIGKNKKYFKLHKFRSMKVSTPHDIPTHMLEKPEQYITKVGKYIRAHSLDELPQIWDIFIGNMSIIGPRPALWNQDVLIAERDKYGANDVKPGLTGWAQINGRDELEISVKAKLDGEYVKKESLLFDAKCFFSTIKKVIKDESVIEGGTGEMEKKDTEEDGKVKKKILVICQYYKPEPFRISDICEEMVRRGHEVHVVTGYPNYPEGVLYKGYGKGEHIDEVVNGVKIHRCYTIPRQTGMLKRILNYYSYAISSTAYIRSKKCKTLDGKPYDVVFCNQLSPVIMSSAAIAYKKKYNVPVVMYCLDLWPESLIAGGIKRSSMIYKYFHSVSKKIYCSMDRIFVTSRMFSDYLQKEFEICKEKIEYLPQYAEGIFEVLEPKQDNGMIDLMFAGNIGTAQSVETIIKAAKILSNEPVRFHIVGSGTELKHLKNISKGLENVYFYGRRPLKDMPEMYKKADAMLITLQADPILSMTLPGKVQSYMAVGKPIIGAIDGETEKIILDASCGYCGKAEDEEELAKNIKKFIKNPNRILMGKNARDYYEKYFEQERFMDIFEKCF